MHKHDLKMRLLCLLVSVDMYYFNNYFLIIIFMLQKAPQN